MKQLDNEIMYARLTIVNFRLTIKLLLTLFIFHISYFIIFAQTEYEAPKLTCTLPFGSQTEINWNLPLTPNPCFAGYEIYSSAGNKNGPYTLAATIANPTITTTTLNISSGTPPFVYFYIINRGSCNNPTPLANKTSDTLFTDKPTAIEIKNVSVINNQIQINWLPSPSPEVIGYFIYNNLDGSALGFNNPDTVFGRLTSTFTDTKHNPKGTVVTYAVRAFYSCQSALPDFVQGGITPPDARHTTIRLNNVTAPSNCDQTVSVEWTKYLIGSSLGNVVTYDIETNTDNLGFVVQKTVDNTIQNNVVQNIPYLKPFCIRIKANLSNGTSSYSNEICFDSLQVIQKPKDDYIRNITVENGNIIIEYRKDTLATPLPSFINPVLNRSEEGITFTGGTSNSVVFENQYLYLFSDNNLDVNNKVYWYNVQLNDSCGVKHFSDTAITLRIGIKTKGNNKADIIWRGFEVDNISFVHFRLEKIIGTDTTSAGTFTRNQTSFLEQNLFDYTIDSLDEVCYRITAVFTNNNDIVPRETLESHSNIICVRPEPQAFVPQAFVPDGYNKTFKPFLIFAVADNYSFQIYDRWYRLLFSTNDVNASWNGKDLKGENSPNDGYIYTIKFTGKNGQDYTQSGTVMLLR